MVTRWPLRVLVYALMVLAMFGLEVLLIRDRSWSDSLSGAIGAMVVIVPVTELRRYLRRRRDRRTKDRVSTPD